MELSSNDNDDMPTACSPSLPNESKTTHKAVRKEESFSTKVVPLNKCLFKRKLERNRHQTELRLDQLGDKDILINKLREITKPVLKELEVEISTKGKNKSAFAQIPMNFTPRQDEQMLEPVCRSFTKEEEEAMLNAIHESTHNHKAVKSKTIEAPPTTIVHPKTSVFGFIDFKSRTNNFYQSFAKETIENDIIREEKIKKRITGKSVWNQSTKLSIRTKKNPKITEEEKESFIENIKASPKKVAFASREHLMTPPSKNNNRISIIKETPKIRIKRKMIKSASPQKTGSLERSKDSKYACFGLLSPKQKNAKQPLTKRSLNQK